MTRRIVLSDEEVASKDFFEGLDSLNFEKKDGLWVPPNQIATGSILVASSMPEDDLYVDFKVRRRPSGTVLLQAGFPIRGYYQWVAMPGCEFILQSGRRLKGIQLMANVE